ncbi:MAG TPA: alpha/beta fold hydrolase [Bacteroidales bacterium]|nr:alpha/beta fold hydrolase [Bacteroidales bacterium]
MIFIHGLAGGETTFGGTVEYLRDNQGMGPVNVFDMVLNADNDTETALMSGDVRWNDFVYDGDSIYLGRRNYDVSFDEYTHTWEGENLFVVNFKEEAILGAQGTLNDHFDQSNQSAIFKQGFALSKMIDEVLEYTGAEKVILVGHSMGGMAIREYLQRTDGQGTHLNWQNPWLPDGHKVARVVTFGTPHLGSNTSPDPTKSNTPSATGNSEANRDLLWEYDSYNFCEDSTLYKGIYMFGGYEHCIESESGVFGNSTFDNVDINCDGDHDDHITGINESFYTYRDNPDMPLPDNIRYTWLTSIWADWASPMTGDGAVDINRQWLHHNGQPVPEGLADTCLASVFHTSEGGDYATVIRGLDEPETFALAYTIHPGDSITGFITAGQDYQLMDTDMFLIPCGSNEALEIGILNGSDLIDSMFVFDTFHNQLEAHAFTDSAPEVQITLASYNTDSLYVSLKGQATSDSWGTPYRLFVNPSVPNAQTEHMVNGLADVFPNPAHNNLHIRLTGSGKAQILLMDTQGRHISAGYIEEETTMYLNHLEPGCYLLKIEQNKTVEFHRILITD